MYYTSRTTYVEPYKSFEAIAQSHQLVVSIHTPIPTIHFFTTSYINAHSRVALSDGFYVYTKTLVLIEAICIIIRYF